MTGWRHLWLWLPMIAAGAGAAAPPAPQRDCAECPELVALPAGRFTMGAAPEEETLEQIAGEFRGRSAPRRTVEVGRFSIGRFEVTRGEFGAFVAASGHRASGCFVWEGGEHRLLAARSWQSPGFAQDDRHPATCISWEDAEAYTRWLSQRTGRRYRLPSEAEWEYAARAGTATHRYWGNDMKEVCRHANGADLSTRREVPEAADWAISDCDDGHAYTAPVGRFAPNAFGLHDPLGNVAEWTADCWNPDYRGAPATAVARSDGDCYLRAVRGGAWDEASAGLRAAYRVGSPVVVRVYARGFRVVREEP
jgi:formylglycine-generating enzyme required for sulfatase activity